MQAQPLTPSPYLRDIRDHLKAREPHLWAWYSSDKLTEEYADGVRLELLKRTYRLDPEDHEELYKSAGDVADKLGLTVPLTLYQGGDESMGAALFYLPDAAHLVLLGPIVERLDPAELRSIFGHELAHHVLWGLDGGSLHTTQRLLAELCGDERTDPSYQAASRLFSLYTEIFADRGGCLAGEVTPAITALVKVCTGARMVSAKGYLKQAKEVVATGLRSEGISHPEVFIRALALDLWASEADGFDEAIRNMVEGTPPLNELDPLRRLELMAHTRAVMEHIFVQPWMRSDALLAHAHKFFHDFTPIDIPDELVPLPTADITVRHFLAHFLLDFVAADEALDDAPLLAVHVVAQKLDLIKAFEDAANKELKITRKVLAKMRTQRDERLLALLSPPAGDPS